MGKIGYLSPVPRQGNGALPPPSQWFHDRVTGAPHADPIWEDASTASAANTAPVQNVVNNGATALVASTTPTLDAAMAWNAAQQPGGKLPIVAVGMSDSDRVSVTQKVTGVVTLSKSQNQKLAAIIKAVPGVNKVTTVFEQGNDSKAKQSNRIHGKYNTIAERDVGKPVNWNNEFQQIAAAGFNAAIVLSSPLTAGNAAAVVAAANTHVPLTIYGGDGFANGLMSYGPERKAVYEAAADIAVQVSNSNGAVIPGSVTAPNVRLKVSQGQWAAAVPGHAIPATLANVPVIQIP